MTEPDIRAYIDHTVLRPEATKEQVIQACDEAKQHRFAAMCVNPCFIPLVASCLKGTKVGVGAAIGFPLGTTTTDVKVFEAKDALRNGATELDMVINVGALKSGDLNFVEAEIALVVSAARGKAIVKVILETCLLTTDEIVAVCKLAMKARADFVKTSTGFSTAGATAEQVALMRKTVGDVMGVKASGGIRTYQAAMDMIRAGATRIGTSAGVKIVQEQEAKK